MSSCASSSFGSTFQDLAARFKRHDSETTARLRDAECQSRSTPKTSGGSASKQQSQQKEQLVHLYRRIPPLQHPQPRKPAVIDRVWSFDASHPSESCSCCHLQRTSIAPISKAARHDPQDMSCSKIPSRHQAARVVVKPSSARASTKERRPS